MVFISLDIDFINGDIIAGCVRISCKQVLHDLYVDLMVRTKPDKYAALSGVITYKLLLFYALISNCINHNGRLTVNLCNTIICQPWCFDALWNLNLNSNLKTVYLTPTLHQVLYLNKGCDIIKNSYSREAKHNTKQIMCLETLTLVSVPLA